MKLLKSKKKLIGQGMTEYLVIVGVIGIGALAAFTFMGGTLRETTGGLTAQFMNDAGSASTAIANADVNVANQAATGGQQSTLGNFDTVQAVTE
ncbi:MAG: hypothetical protein COB51_01305 [Moraxellaceae bacterium]|nr:MAG: hypothetical protein COB51_01305 [Moraxellaceae bacterium]